MVCWWRRGGRRGGPLAECGPLGAVSGLVPVPAGLVASHEAWSPSSDAAGEAPNGRCRRRAVLPHAKPQASRPYQEAWAVGPPAHPTKQQAAAPSNRRAINLLTALAPI